MKMVFEKKREFSDILDLAFGAATEGIFEEENFSWNGLSTSASEGRQRMEKGSGRRQAREWIPTDCFSRLCFLGFPSKWKAMMLEKKM